jgi:hypothetical protein
MMKAYKLVEDVEVCWRWRIFNIHSKLRAFAFRSRRRLLTHSQHFRGHRFSSNKEYVREQHHGPGSQVRRVAVEGRKTAATLLRGVNDRGRIHRLERHRVQRRVQRRYSRTSSDVSDSRWGDPELPEYHPSLSPKHLLQR